MLTVAFIDEKGVEKGEQIAIVRDLKICYRIQSTKKLSLDISNSGKQVLSLDETNCRSVVSITVISGESCTIEACFSGSNKDKPNAAKVILRHVNLVKVESFFPEIIDFQLESVKIVIVKSYLTEPLYNSIKGADLYWVLPKNGTRSEAHLISMNMNFRAIIAYESCFFEDSFPRSVVDYLWVSRCKITKDLPITVKKFMHLTDLDSDAYLNFWNTYVGNQRCVNITPPLLVESYKFSQMRKMLIKHLPELKLMMHNPDLALLNVEAQLVRGSRLNEALDVNVARQYRELFSFKNLSNSWIKWIVQFLNCVLSRFQSSLLLPIVWAIAVIWIFEKSYTHCPVGCDRSNWLLQFPSIPDTLELMMREGWKEYSFFAFFAMTILSVLGYMGKHSYNRFTDYKW